MLGCQPCIDPLGEHMAPLAFSPFCAYGFGVLRKPTGVGGTDGERVRQGEYVWVPVLREGCCLDHLTPLTILRHEQDPLVVPQTSSPQLLGTPEGKPQLTPCSCALSFLPSPPTSLQHVSMLT